MRKGKQVKRRQKVRLGPPTEREKQAAARKLQGLFRTRAARRRIRLLARSVFEKVYDPDTGAYFYHNTHTGDVSWVQPKLLGKEEFETVGDTHATPHQIVEAYRNLARHWMVYSDESSGGVYYYNVSSEETTWEKPEIVAKLDDAIQERNDMLGPDWKEHIDEAGNYYFYNESTQESSWEPPKVDFRKPKTKGGKEKKSKSSKKTNKNGPKKSKNKGSKKKQSQIDSKESDSDDSGPPEAIELGENWEEQLELLQAQDDDDNDSIYVSSDEETSKRSTLQGKALEKYSTRRAAQKENFEKKLESLKQEEIEELNHFLSRVQIKRCIKKKRTYLELGGFMLTEFPTKIVALPLSKTLQNIDLGFNQIPSIPDDIKQLREVLCKLSMESNMLIRIPVQLWYCTKLTELDLRNNRIKEIAREKGNMQVLRETNLWDIGIETLVNLRVLRVDRNLLKCLPDELGHLLSLETLSARGNVIEEISSASLAALKNLRKLDLSCNSLENLPDDTFGKLENLQVLLLDQNRLGEFPSDFGRMQSLRVLDSADNKLTVLPANFHMLERLEILKLARNELDSLPREWSKHSLRVVDLMHNSLTQVPAGLGECSKLEHLNLSHNKIRSRLPEGIGCLPALKTLNASHNKLDLVGFGHEGDNLLPSLISLDLSYNQIRSVHSSLIFGIPLLAVLDLSHNNLQEIGSPESSTNEGSTARRSALRKVNLCENKLSLLPRELFQSSCLQWLDCSGNEIKSIPSDFECAIETLEHFELSNNKLNSVPMSMKKMKVLKYLCLNKNRLTSRPDFLDQVQTLQSWQMSDNPIERTFTPSEIRKKLMSEAESVLGRSLYEEAQGIFNKVEENYLEEFLGEISEAPENGGIVPEMTFSKLIFSLRAQPQEETDLYATLLWKRGISSVAQERYTNALTDFNRALGLRNQPEAGLLYFRAIARYRGQNDVSGAVADLDEAIQLNPDYFPAYNVRASCLIDLGHYDKALADSSFVLENNMYDTDALLFRGLAFERMGKLEDALDVYRETVETETFNIGQNFKDQSGPSETKDKENENKNDGEALSATLLENLEIRSSSEDSVQSKQQLLKMEDLKRLVSAWSPLGTAYYRSGLVLRDLLRPSDSIAQFEAAADLLCSQRDKAIEGSLRAKKLGELYRLAVLCKSSALQSMNRKKKAMDAYEEAQEIAKLIVQSAR